MTVTIEGRVECDELPGIKRLYLPGLSIHAICPKCKGDVVDDLSKEYVACCPTIGKPIHHGLICFKCDHEWEICVQIDITLTEIEEPTP